MESLFNRLLVTLTELPLCSLRTLSPFNLLCLLLHAGGQTGRWSWAAQSNTRFPSLIALSGFFSGHSRHFLIVLTLSVDGGLHLLFADTLIHLVTASSVNKEVLPGHGGARHTTTEAGQPGEHTMIII